VQSQGRKYVVYEELTEEFKIMDKLTDYEKLIKAVEYVKNNQHIDVDGIPSLLLCNVAELINMLLGSNLIGKDLQAVKINKK